MKKVETHEFETATMKQFKLEKELEELRAVDPALADQHLKETISELKFQAFTSFLGFCFWLYVLYVVFTVF